MHMDPVIPQIVGGVSVVLVVGLLLRAVKQPYVVAYLLTGIALGPSGLELVSDATNVSRLGEIGVILLLFFVGMEISLPELVSKWKVPVAGTLVQIGLSLGCAFALGAWQGWPWQRSVLLGFVMSLSSTAVVVKLLQSRGDAHSPIGKDAVAILIMQDLAIVPMMIVIGLLGGYAPTGAEVGLQIVGGVGILGLLLFVATRERLRLPLGSLLKADRELQVFGACLLCFVLALITGLAGLSAALGAFLGGLIVGAARETEWVREALFPFHVLLLALFFVSIGMLIDLRFVADNAVMVGALVVAVLVTNTFVNLLTFRMLGRSWSRSLYGGALLAQIGEFSFVLAAVGKSSGLIAEYSYQATIAVIALTMLLSPAWIGLAAVIHAQATQTDST